MSWFGRAAPPPALLRLDPGHADDCARLHASAFPHGWSALDFERLIAAPASFGDAAVDGRSDALAGFVLSRGAAGEAEVLTVVVAPHHRGRGLGRRLLDRHLHHLAAARIGQLFLEVEEGNVAARALYASMGFAEVGRREAYYRAHGGEAAAALVLRRATG